ncbi:MAG TPA: hypothetical protein VK028_05990 [Micromonosporaceae bacterium]|nr:hypothetical protein [Micromonosporaceae bacterium]
MTRLVRTATALLAAAYLGWGAWATVAPRHFFDTFPGFGQRWTAAYPPFNEHLMADLGATFLTLGFLLAVGAALPDRRVRRTVLAGALVFNTLHLFFHATHHGLLAGWGLGASLASLVVGVLLPAILIALDRRPARAREPEAERSVAGRSP